MPTNPCVSAAVDGVASKADEPLLSPRVPAWLAVGIIGTTVGEGMETGEPMTLDGRLFVGALPVLAASPGPTAVGAPVVTAVGTVSSTTLPFLLEAGSFFAVALRLLPAPFEVAPPAVAPLPAWFGAEVTVTDEFRALFPILPPLFTDAALVAPIAAGVVADEIIGVDGIGAGDPTKLLP